MFNKYDAKIKRICFFLSLIVCLIVNACKIKPNELPYQVSQTAKADSGMVVSAHPLASQVGVEILQQGGNAIDAAIAVQFALAVVYPRAGNLGGGGFMVIRLDNGETAALDYREKAPMAAFRDMYLDSLGNPIATLSREGHLSVGVPGTVAGMVAASQKYGQLSLDKLVMPAIKLAREGFAVSSTEAERLNNYKEQFLQYNDADIPFIKQEKWNMADVLVQPDLAQTLSLIKDKGKVGFYEGETAKKIVAEMEEGKGLISLEDLKQYEAVWRTPIIGEFKDKKIITMPPASSGGIALMQLLNIIEDYPISEWGFQSPESIHLIAEAMRRVYADRAEHVGDSDFYPVPIDSMIDEEYLNQRMADYSATHATPSDTINAGNFNFDLESFETTHTSVVDKDGNAVSVTTTLNLNYGSKVIVDGAGFFLNDEMDDFSAKPGTPNFFGLIGAEANAIQPEKRMLSSMTPTITEKNDQLHLVLGAPGGSTIITAVLQVFLNVNEFKMDLEDAVNAKRFHHQWLPDQIRYEKAGLDSMVIKALQAKGHELKEVNRMAIVKAIEVLDNGQLHGVGDARNPDDHAAGY